MRMRDITGGWPAPVSNEEAEFLVKYEDAVVKSDLTPRERELARQLTNRGFLRRERRDGKLVYVNISTETAS